MFAGVRNNERLLPRQANALAQHVLRRKALPLVEDDNPHHHLILTCLALVLDLVWLLALMVSPLSGLALVLVPLLVLTRDAPIIHFYGQC